MTPDQAYAKVLKIVGGVEALAVALGTTSQAIYQWKGTVPGKQVSGVLAAMRGALRAQRRETQHLPTKQDLRPDLFPRKPKGAKNGKAKKESRPEAQEGGGDAKTKDADEA